MIFRQLFDSDSGTDTCLLTSRSGGEALIIDPVLEKVDRYFQLARELDLRLVKAVHEYAKLMNSLRRAVIWKVAWTHGSGRTDR